jgi:hypothetical protein
VRRLLPLVLALALLGHASADTFAVKLELPFELAGMYEKTLGALGPFEWAAGTEITVDLAREELLQLTPFTVACYYSERDSLCLEARAPIVGGGTWLRLIVTTSW